ncbi:TPA: orotidine-5'-phosphate decarboxylase [Candidatus Galligastranaerophilus faecipullorum]|nr:orotidine-5'-phosphate decarboxylase [Candidatus Galligastranaerophilus faecipullorum]
MINEKIKEKIVLALDVETLEEAKKLVDELSPYVGTFKVGLQLYTGFGNEIIDYIKSKNSNFFLDVKLMDIPNTVKKASENIVLRGANFYNVHALGGLEMMKQSKEGAYKAAEKLGKKPPLILAVTVLTSISQEVLDNEIKVNTQVRELAINLAKLAKEAGLDGVVASVHELRAIKEACGEDFKVLCPGIRPLWSLKDDQKRIATPAQALKDGADFLVIGRAVTAAEDRVEAMKKIYEETGVI